MNKETKRLYQNIMNNRNPEENLPGFFGSLANQYHTLAAVRLALHYYSFYETYCEEGDRWGEAARTSLEQINRVIGENVLGFRSGKEHEETVKAVDRLRNDIIHRMKLLTSYFDVCRIKEYLLNRIEYRFKVSDFFMDDDAFAREILAYIFETKDNVIINDRIQEVVGQLPVRMTRLKFFDLIRESLHEYVGAGQDTLDGFLYMLRSSALLELPQEPDPLYPSLWEMKQRLLSQDYKNISVEEYEKGTLELREAVELFEGESEVYYSLQEIINELYTLLLCHPYVGVSASSYEKEEQAAFELIRGIHEEFLRGQKEEPSDDLLKHFSVLEGVQEELSFDLLVQEEALYQADQNHRKLAESIMADKLLNILLLAKDLLSNSLFIDFYEVKSTLPVTKEKADEEADRLTEKLARLFESCDRMAMRAVMANLLDKLPVFFEGHKEVMDYVRNALEKCSDPAEKAACMEIIMNMIRE